MNPMVLLFAVEIINMGLSPCGALVSCLPYLVDNPTLFTGLTNKSTCIDNC